VEFVLNLLFRLSPVQYATSLKNIIQFVRNKIVDYLWSHINYGGDSDVQATALVSIATKLSEITAFAMFQSLVQSQSLTDAVPVCAYESATEMCFGNFGLYEN
jgi:hypothetical protein